MAELINFVPDLRNYIKDIVSILDVQHNWGVSFLNADEAWKYTQGENVKVAVIDTGWFPHKDLIDNFIEGYDATGNNDFLDHGSFHSTHCAGIIAANCGDNVGVMGIAPKSKIIVIKSLNDDGCGSYDYIVNALQIAHDLDVDIINMSLGSPVAPDNQAVHDLIKSISAQGKIVVCASGNDGKKELNYPAHYDEAVSVAAVDQSGQLAKFSSTGPQLDAAAPGVQIYSTWGDNQYALLSGTSMACPAISGVIALIISWYKKNKDLNFVINQENITKLLFDLGGPTGQHIIEAGVYNIGIPKFANMIWKK
jgi:subtilisin family serine protease